MKLKLMFVAILAVAFWQSGARAADGAGGKPNILLILVDDMGYSDLGVTGAKDIPTPHIDALAASGVWCTAAYVTAPYCSPSRAGILTGRYQNRFGYEFNPTGRMPDAGLRGEQVTIAERLKPAGYATALVGKWHLGNKDGMHPMEQGFDEFFGMLGGGHSYFPKGGGAIQRNREPAREREYLTDAFGREASSFIERRKGQPWFLYLSFNAVHDPMQPKEEDLPRVPNARGKLRKPYAGMMVALDDAVGRVMKTLRETGQAERTLVVFLNDNGGPTAPINSNVNGSANTPFTGGKRQLSEGGIRVPAIFVWPGKLPANRTYRAPVMAFDVVPTALAAANVDVPADTKLDGVNLLPYLDGVKADAPHKALYWRFGRQYAVRQGDWKLVRWKHDDGQGFTTGLYNLVHDPSERNDLQSKHPAKAAKLAKAWRDWNKDNPAPRFGSVRELEEAKDLAENGPVP